MKAQIHPTWYPEAIVTCACGNSFAVGATFPELRVDVCYNCHPFYTGQMKYVDTAGRVDAFRAKMSKVGGKVMSKSEKRQLKRKQKLARELERPDSLEELRKVASGKKRKLN